MEKNYYEYVKKEYIMSAMNTNDYAEEKDINRNHTNYGSLTTWATVLRNMGHDTRTDVWQDDNGCLRIPCISIDHEDIVFEKGKTCKQN